MNKESEDAIRQLEDLKIDRESFLNNDKEHDEIYLKDIKAIETVLSEDYISKEKIKGKFEDLKRQYKEHLVKK